MAHRIIAAAAEEYLAEHRAEIIAESKQTVEQRHAEGRFSSVHVRNRCTAGVSSERISCTRFASPWGTFPKRSRDSNGRAHCLERYVAEREQRLSNFEQRIDHLQSH
jgi:hypothetical protein